MSLVFWLLAAAMLGVALLFFLPVMLRGSGVVLDTTEQQNLTLARERLKELEQEKASGAISEEAFVQARQELEQQLATDLVAQSQVRTSQKTGRGLMGAVLILLPVLAVALYQFLGEPAVLGSEPASASSGMPKGHTGMTENGELPSVDAMVAGLAAKLDQQPDNPEGWYMLGRSYMSLQRYNEAVTAYERLQQLVGDDPDILVAYADALAMTQDGSMAGKPLELIERALTLQPDHATGLWLAGMAYRQEDRLADAITHWQKARAVLADDPQSQAELETLIANARQQMGDAGTVTASEPETLPAIMSARIEVAVTLDKTLLDQVSPDDTVFILARAVDGPPMPLAVVKKQVKDLPLTVTLDDSQAMMPAMKLSRFPEVSVVARVSKSGSPIAQSGDLEGEVPANPLEHPSVNVLIQTQVP